MAYRLLNTSRRLEKFLYKNIKLHNVDSKNISVFRKALNTWRLYCEKPPKGFEKYFEPSVKNPSKDLKEASKKDAKGKQTRSEPKPPPPPPSRSQPGSSKPYDQWSFGLFGGTGNRGSGGKPPFGDGNKEKWYAFGAVGAIALLAGLGFWEMGYKEIGWKEFVHTYLAKGIVDKLEVINKKWVRVKLSPGNTIDGYVSFTPSQL